MKRMIRLKTIVLICALNALVACASLGEDGDPPYQVGVGSAIYAGSKAPLDKTKAGADVYFGQYVVRTGGDGRGCCYSTGMSGGNLGRPAGAVLAVWSASEYGDEKYFSEQYNEWLAKRIDKRFYYAVAQQSQLAPYPVKVKGHRSYGIYVSVGKVAVGEKGLRPENSNGAVRFIQKSDGAPKYVFGREDTLYYKILSHGSGVASVADDASPWHAIPGVAITEAQYFELLKCSPGLECRWFLSPTDPDLTPEQREYAQKNSLRPGDMEPLIKDFERSRRQHNRWL